MTIAETNERLKALYDTVQRIEVKQNEINGDLKNLCIEMERVKVGSRAYKVLTPVLTGLVSALTMYIVTSL